MTDSEAWEAHRHQNGGVPFITMCDRSAFSEFEITLLGKWGHVFEGLAQKRFEPTTKSRCHFVSVANGVDEPVTEAERIWRKYVARLEFEALRRESPSYHHFDQSEDWYPRDECKRGIHFDRGPYFTKVKHK